jgi:hypothetical protein
LGLLLADNHSKREKDAVFDSLMAILKVERLQLSLRETVPLNMIMRACLSVTLCLLMAGAMAPIQTHAALAGKGLVCADKGELLSGWTTADQPLSSVVAHWFDDKRVSTIIWQRTNDNIQMKATRRGIPYETDMLSITWTLRTKDSKRIISIDRKTGQRSVMQDGRALITVNCEIFNTEKTFQEKLTDITKNLQSNYDLKIANHKL